MFSGKFFLAVIVIAVAISFIQWFFIGFLFHKYQSLTPSTWRKENNRSYAASMIISLFFAFFFSTIFYLWKNKSGDMHFSDGIEFGGVCWLAFSVTTEIGNAIYVNYSKVFVFGKCLSSFVEYIVAGIVAVTLL
ncbi:MAG TPA: DUF1761 domain-containing protein [Puia sp.]|jgi:hypothetical protein